MELTDQITQLTDQIKHLTGEKRDFYHYLWKLQYQQKSLFDKEIKRLTETELNEFTEYPNYFCQVIKIIEDRYKQKSA